MGVNRQYSPQPRHLNDRGQLVDFIFKTCRALQTEEVQSVAISYQDTLMAAHQGEK